MILPDLLDEIFEVLDAADIGLHVPGDGPGVHGSVPAPYMELPDVTYGAGGPGLDRIEDLGLTIVFGPANNSHVFRTALAYASTTGALSITAAFRAHHWTSCGTLRVGRAEPTIESLLGANPALAYTFHLDITGAP
jgi:hypothetical protein